MDRLTGANGDAMDVLGEIMRLMWIGALASAPVALIAFLICRAVRLGPTTRHALWVMVLASFVTPGLAELAGVRVRLPVDAPARTVDATDRVAGRDNGEVEGVDARFDEPGSWVAPPDRAASPWEPEMSLEPVAIGAPEIAGGDAWGSKERAEPLSGPVWGDAGGPRADWSWDDAVGQPTVGVRGDARADVVGEPVADVDALAPIGGPSAAAGGAGAAAPARGDGLETGPAPLAAWWGQMTDAGVRARDAIASIPPVPMPVWLGGIAVLLVIKSARCARFRYLLSRAGEADAGTAEMVADVSREMGLRRRPRVVVLGKPISPLVWCGARPVLVLPRGLWGELDEGARRAVLMHELAHLKRRDHMVMWAAQCVGVLYWWHPIAWWVRRRIDEEADLACDAWVTALQPVSRRVYAETLLMARSFVSAPGARTAPGLAMASSRTKRFARRLKMVMTENASPRLSLLGVALAAGLAMAGAVVTPALACPEKDKEKASVLPTAQVVETSPESAPLALLSAGVVDMAPEVAVLAEHAAESGGSTFEAFMAGEVQPEDDDLRELLARLRRLEAELAAIKAYVGDVAGEGRSGARTAPQASGGAIQRQRATEARALADARAAERGLRTEQNRRRALEREVQAERERADRRDETRARAEALRAREAEMRSRDLAAEAMARREAQREIRAESGAQRARAAEARAEAERAIARGDYERARALGRARAGAPDAAPDEPQSYYLSNPGKLEALTELMARSDVPVLIERHNDKIVVHGDARVQRTFAAFVKMIDPDARTPSIRSGPSSGVRAAPSPRAPGAPAGLPGARGGPTTDAVPGVSGARGRGVGGARAPREPREPRVPSAPGAGGGSRSLPPESPPQAQLEDLRRQREAQIAALSDEMNQLKAERASLIDRLRQVQLERDVVRREAEEAEARAEDMESRVEDLQEELEESLEELEEAEAREKDEIRAMTARLQSRLADVSSRAAVLHAQRDEAEHRADMLEQMAEEIEEMSESLEDRSDALERHLEEVLEALDERADREARQDR
jgi:beta-lactamase regulating signal transducer with metallopeptidase domain